MNTDRDFLINRLIHKVKNELATLQLAVANLNYLLNDFNLSPQQKKQSKEFIGVIQQNLKNTVHSLSRILILTRNNQKRFKQINVAQVLLEIPLGKEKISLKNNKISLIVKTDPLAFQWFLETLLDKFKNCSRIEVESDEVLSRLIFEFKKNEAEQKKALLNSDDIVLSVNNLILKILAEYLNIELIESRASDSDQSLIVSFNPKLEETLDV
ncbi:hypothetical protein [Caldithrix abyssi]|uniref:Uncharacterized protein n=1 Tax=Caldithrix abyssi DSM 13497 TaxID=880073 RepID=H1XQ32_CALAY|nr:hypothetical protein [Caldithrix abyssi]APF18259.1 hypothetical protein Cabys_1510 [Caldithrix abyssi DSM 13497]EHO42283.1 hypothetical protein Calab_2673 [Caldithrix abyssi DSM 13497]